MAILAGDGLLAYAFEYMADKTEDVPPLRVLKAVICLARAAGASGLVGGQVVDLASEGNPDITLDTLNFIHLNKTAALLEACVVSGGILAGADEATLVELSGYAQDIGLAFQIVDDILDITATQEELGKTAGKDIDAQKATYPSLVGLQESRDRAKELIDRAKNRLAPFGEKAKPLQAIADFIVLRTY